MSSKNNRFIAGSADWTWSTSRVSPEQREAVTIHLLDDGLGVGVLLGRSGTSDIVDAHLVIVVVELSEPILTGDVDDIALLVASIPNNHPRIHRWP